MYTKPMLLNEKLGTQIHSDYQDSYNNTEMFGIEVELEGKGGIKYPPAEVQDMWIPHNDGSLRVLEPNDEAIEYVTRRPYDMTNTVKAVKVLMDFLNKPDIKVYDSYRTSIHVHVNCIADTIMHVCNFITLSILFDELFVSQNGEHRIGNNFCLRSGDAQGQIYDLVKSIQKHGSIFGINAQNRYNSVNFGSLLKFGTVEFRSLECTTDTFRVMHWIKTIYNLKQASRLFADPQDIIRKFSQISTEEFMYSTLGPNAERYVGVPGYQNMMFNGMRLAQDFAFCSKWVPKVEKKEAEVKQKKMKVPDGYANYANAQQEINYFAQLNNANQDWIIAGEDGNAQWVVAEPVAPPAVPAPVADDDDNDWPEEFMEDDEF